MAQPERTLLQKVGANPDEERTQLASAGEPLRPQDHLTVEDLRQIYRPSVLSEPSRLVFPPPWAGHIPFAFWTVDTLRPTQLVELGTHSGNSYCAFLQAVAASGHATACYAVDTWRGDSHAGDYSDEVFDDLSAYHDASYAGFSSLLKMTFDQALGLFPDGSIDLLHIDGLHTYEAAGRDFRNWLPKMSERGLVLMHDINVREREFGVWRVWEEVRGQFPSFAFLHSHGLGVAYVGKSELMPEPLRWLFEVARDPNRLAFVRRHFDRLGKGLSDRLWAQHRLKQVGDLTAHGNALSVQVADRDETVRRLRQQIDGFAGLEEELRRVVEVVNEKDRQISRAGDLLESILEEQAEHSEGLQAELGVAHAKLSAVEAELEGSRRSRSWRITAGLRWAGTRTRTSKEKALAVARAMPKLLDDPALVKRALGFLQRNGLRPTLRRTLEVARGRSPAVPVPREVALPIELDASVAVPFAHRPALPTVAGALPNLAVVCHLFHEELAVEFRRYFLNIPTPFDLFISTSDPLKKSVIEKAFEGWPQGRIEVRVTPNRGRDIAPKLLAFRDVYDRYELVLHLHSKKSDHASLLANWRGFLLENLLGSQEIVESILGAFAQRPDLGMVAAQHFEPVRHWINWGNNYPIAAKLLRQMGVSLSEESVLDFPSGSMFWARSAALKPLLDLELAYEDFAEEHAQIDGTLAHAIERSYFHICEKAGFRWLKVAHPPLFDHTPSITSIERADDLDRFLEAHGLELTGGSLPLPRAVHPPPVVEPTASLIARRTAGALGLSRPPVPASVMIGIITYNNDEIGLRRALDSARIALEEAGCPTAAQVLVLDNGAATERLTAGMPWVHRLPSAGNVGFGAGHNRLMAEAFARGADHYIAANPDGSLHPHAVTALLRMMQAHQNRALIEALQFPVEHPKPYDPFTFETPWLSGACLMVPRAAFNVLGGFDEGFFMYCEDVDLSWRARANGFALRTCPNALFLHGVTNRPRDPRVLRRYFESGILLARKWGQPAFESWLEIELNALGHPLPASRPEPVPAEWRCYADFSHQFSFAEPRW